MSGSGLYLGLEGNISCCDLREPIKCIIRYISEDYKEITIISKDSRICMEEEIELAISVPAERSAIKCAGRIIWHSGEEEIIEGNTGYLARILISHIGRIDQRRLELVLAQKRAFASVGSGLSTRMYKVLIVYHTMTGNTEAMAQAVAAGARRIDHTEVLLKLAQDATVDDLLECDAVAFGSANYLDYIAGELKDFFDRILYPSQGKITGKPYAAFATGGGGGTSILEILDNICSVLKLRKAVDGVSAAGKPSDGVLKECEELGAKLARSLRSGT